jgi:hypothetical protein
MIKVFLIPDNRKDLHLEILAAYGGGNGGRNGCRCRQLQVFPHGITPRKAPLGEHPRLYDFFPNYWTQSIFVLH